VEDCHVVVAEVDSNEPLWLDGLSLRYLDNIMFPLSLQWICTDEIPTLVDHQFTHIHVYEQWQQQARQ
jgi:hypothetical protein